MKISYKWLSQYLPQSIEINKLSEILTNIGLEVEGFEKSESIKGGLAGLVIGEVKTCEPHPNADKLKITTVDIGQAELLHIVCGAPNVAAAQKVVVAPIGTTVYPLHNEAFLIKKAKIRGELSEGMICAEDEIGLGESHDGIMILPQDAIVGTLAKDYFKIPDSDYTIEIGLTPNRSDANSHLGVAKDVCAYLSYHQNEIIKPVLPEIDTEEKATDYVNSLDPFGTPSFGFGNQRIKQIQNPLEFSIDIQNLTACPRYAGITLRNVTIAPSPDWLQKSLLAVGIHPINNVVDITNYVLQEYGQPLHAFDYDKITGTQLVIRKAKDQEKFITLDGKERSLRTEDLMICDAEKPMVIGGVFGGLHSGISNETKNIFLESAYFNPKTIRRTSVHYGLRTDAATHFEKGVAMEMVLPALKRAASLLVEITGAEIASEIKDIYPNPIENRIVPLKYDYLNNLCGKSYDPKKVQLAFQSLGFEIKNQNETEIEVSIPGENQDIHQSADLVEEILRIDGLDNIEIPTRLNIALNTHKQLTNRNLKERIAQHLSYSGLQEIITNSLTNSRYYPEEKNMVHLLNNLSVELDVMRPKMLESGLEVILHNTNRKMQNLKIYEFGKTYVQSEIGKYFEQDLLSIWISGNIKEQEWSQKPAKANEFHIKGIVQNMFDFLGLSKVKESVEENKILWKQGKETIATCYKVNDERLNYFNIKQAVFYAEIDIKNLAKAIANLKVKFEELPKFPSMKRDLALVVNKEITYNKINAIVKSRQWESLKNYELFDVFENEKLGKDKKSLALSLTFQLKERTLTDEEVDKMMTELIKIYENNLNAFVRT